MTKPLDHLIGKVFKAEMTKAAARGDVDQLLEVSKQLVECLSTITVYIAAHNDWSLREWSDAVLEQIRENFQEAVSGETS